MNFSALMNARHSATLRTEETTVDLLPPIDIAMGVSFAGKLSRIIGETTSDRELYLVGGTLFYIPPTGVSTPSRQPAILQENTNCGRRNAPSPSTETDGDPQRSISHFLEANTRVVFARSLGNDA